MEWVLGVALYVKMQRAMYGLVRSALLFYKKLVADLESVGFKLNPLILVLLLRPSTRHR